MTGQSVNSVQVDNNIQLDNNIQYQEWKECQISIRKFDDMILDIRKYGFTLLTILLSADGFLYAKTGIGSGQKFGIFFALMLLNVALVLLDRYHEVFLNGAVKRSMDLEKAMNIALSTSISNICEKARPTTWGTSIYILFCIANIFLVIGSTLDLDSLKSLTTSIINNRILIAIVFAVGFSVVLAIIIYDKNIKNKTNLKPK